MELEGGVEFEGRRATRREMMPMRSGREGRGVRGEDYGGGEEGRGMVHVRLLVEKPEG